MKIWSGRKTTYRCDSEIYFHAPTKSEHHKISNERAMKIWSGRKYPSRCKNEMYIDTLTISEHRLFLTKRTGFFLVRFFHYISLSERVNRVRPDLMSVE